MSAIQFNSPVSVRQPARGFSVGAAHFETDAAKLWGIDEKYTVTDKRFGQAESKLTFILSLKDRRGRLNRDEMRAVARREISYLDDGRHGHWSDGIVPMIFQGHEDHEITSVDVILMSRTQWSVTIWITASFDPDPDPAGYWEWATSRGVR